MARVIRATTEVRQKLGEVIPLRAPFTAALNITNVCNFRCVYCAHSNRPAGLKNEMMPWEIYQKSVDGLSALPQKLKLLLLAGLGEPLAHPQIDKMVAYAKERQTAETIRIITNASLLTHELSDRLIDAGLDHLKISIQGLDDAAYKKMCGTGIPLARIMDNIAYFYRHKKHTTVNVKIVADAFEKPEDEQRFYEMFDDICDVMNIEHISPYQESVDYGKLTGDKFVLQSGNQAKLNKLCYTPFYLFSIYPDGTVIPCCYNSFESYKQLSMGNVMDMDLAAFWNSEEMNRFRLSLLRDERAKMPVCATCRFFQSAGNPEDNIDEYAETLIRKYQELLGD